MSFNLNVEADTRLTEEQVHRALNLCGVTSIAVTVGGFSCEFPCSGVRLVYKKQLDDQSVLTEDAEDCNWAIGARIYISYNMNNFDQSSIDVKKFVEAMALESKAYFILSFQFERTYAIKDSMGFRLLERF